MHLSLSVREIKDDRSITFLYLTPSSLRAVLHPWYSRPSHEMQGQARGCPACATYLLGYQQGGISLFVNLVYASSAVYAGVLSTFAETKIFLSTADVGTDLHKIYCYLLPS